MKSSEDSVGLNGIPKDKIYVSPEKNNAWTLLEQHQTKFEKVQKIAVLFLHMRKTEPLNCQINIAVFQNAPLQIQNKWGLGGGPDFWKMGGWWGVPDIWK